MQYVFKEVSSVYPHLFGIEWLEMYNIMMFIGIFVALLIIRIYAKKLDLPYEVFRFYMILIIVSIFIGLIAAFGFQQLYNYIDDVQNGREYYARGMTFMGGLIGGVVAFLMGVKFYGKKDDKANVFKMISIAAFAIPVAHFFGRIGCTMAGCCHGIATDSWIGIQFVTTTTTVIPTQLIEAIFLLALSIVLFMLLERKKWQYNIFIYAGSYSVFRFIIEYYRGDARGTFLPWFSPSQWQVLFMFMIIIAMFIIYKVKQDNKVLKY